MKRSALIPPVSLRGLAIALALSGPLSGVAQASIVLTDYTETATSFEAIYAFTPDVTPLDAEASGLGSWSATTTQSYLAGSLGGPGTMIFTWEGLHTAAPHDGESPSPLPTAGECRFSAGVTSGRVCDWTAMSLHPLGTHYDEYRFVLDLDNGGGYAVFSGVHVGEVPVPAAAWLLGSGLAVLAATRARRKSSR